MAQNHPFIDGNKRSAFAATYTFLAMNGGRITAGADDVYGFIIGLYESGGGGFNFEQVVRWLRGNVVVGKDDGRRSCLAERSKVGWGCELARTLREAVTEFKSVCIFRAYEWAVNLISMLAALFILSVLAVEFPHNWGFSIKPIGLLEEISNPNAVIIIPALYILITLAVYALIIRFISDKRAGFLNAARKRFCAGLALVLYNVSFLIFGLSIVMSIFFDFHSLYLLIVAFVESAFLFGVGIRADVRFPIETADHQRNMGLKNSKDTGGDESPTNNENKNSDLGSGCGV